MFTSTTIRVALTLPILSALLVTLPGQPSPALGQAATVLSSVHYQRKLDLNCSSNICAGDFPAVAAKRRLNLTRISCLITASPGSTFSRGLARVIDPLAAPPERVFVYLPGVFSSGDGSFTLNEPVDLQVNAAQHVEVRSVMATGTALVGTCSAFGTLERLQ